MSGGDDFQKRANWRDQCMQKIRDIRWKKIEGDYEITTIVDAKGNHTITKRKIK